jgi:hypothetical protein
MCQRCGGNRSLDVHHRVALKDGGAPYDPTNLEVLCRSCHRDADKTDRRFFREAPSTSRLVDFSLPDAGKTPEKSREERRSSRNWSDVTHVAEAQPESRDWGDGVYFVDGEAVSCGWNRRAV